jgi:3-hydroxyacyl-[acyl-carrier-protein] dehydratase
MAQLGGLVMLDPKDQEAKEQFFFGGIEGCRFRRPVVPGDTLVRNCRWDWEAAAGWQPAQ